MKKKVSLMLSVIMLLQIILPMVSVIWESGFTIKSIAATTYEATDSNGIIWTYELQDNKAINVMPKNKNSLPAQVTIPTSLDGYTVTSIGNEAFYYCTTLTSVGLPSSLTAIGQYAFAYCSSLKTITIPEGVTSIGESTFSSCSNLTSIKLPSSLTTIGGNAFSSCSSLASITIPQGVTSIEYSAFRWCTSLTSIGLPTTLISIGKGTFTRCTSLKSITIPEGVISIGESVFSDCSNLTNIGLPSTLTNIGGYAFSTCSSLTTITIPQGVTSIGEYAFKYCNNLTKINVKQGNQNYISENGILFDKNKTEIICYPANKEGTKYTIPSTVKSIGNEAFRWCTSLTSIGLPSGLTSIGDSAFYNCSSLTSITIPAGVTSIGEGAFYLCDSLTSITVPAGVTSIGANTFYGCSNLTNITISQGVTNIGNSAFYGCDSLASITIPKGVTTIGNRVFYGCDSLASITIPEGVTSIGEYAFMGCSSLTKIEIPQGVTSLGNSAFYGCSSLSSIELSSSLENIGDSAFYGCSSLTKINVEEGNLNYASENGILFNKNKTEIICYPAKKEGTKYTIPNTVTHIGDSAFSDCINLTSITIPEGVIDIGEYAFSGCSKLTSITIPQGVTRIEDSVFSGCKSLISIELPSNLTSIGDNAFFYCSSLTGIELPSSLKSIEGSAFHTCSNLRSVTIPEGVTSIGQNTFNYCSSLTKITIPQGVTSIGSKVFMGCSNVTIYCSSNSTAEKYAKDNNVTYVIDDEAPIITNVEGNPSEWTKENVTLKVNASDNLSGLASKAYSFDGGATWQVENIKEYTENTSNIEIQVRDNLGNISTQTVNITKIDKENPIITSVEGNSSEWTKENVTLKVNASDNLSGLAEEAYSFDGGTTWQAQNTKTYTESTSEIAILVRDKASNVVTYEGINTTKIDKDAPVITSVEGNPSDWTRENVILKINASDGLSGLAEKAYSFDGGTTWQAENSKIYTENTSGIVIKVKDKMGYVTTYEEEINISKITKLTRIEITTVPKTEYIEGQKFDKTGMIVTAIYDNGTTEVVQEYTVSPERALTQEDTKVIISYTEKGITKTAEQEIEVVAKSLTGIEVKTNPGKVSYKIGETLNTEGLVFIARYDNGSVEEVTEGFTCTPTTLNSVGTQEITVTYKGQTAIFNVTVADKSLTGIEINNVPDRTEYVEGQTFDKTGMVVTAIYDNGTTAVIGEYTISPEGALTPEDTKVIISYEEKGTTKTVEQQITVIKKGDVNRDNVVDFMDILAINKHRLGKTQLTGDSQAVADVNEDEIIDFMDILRINKYRLGKINSL